MKMDTDNDFYIQLLLEAKEEMKNPEGTTYNQFVQKLKERPKMLQHSEVLYNAIYAPLGGMANKGAHMGMDAYFRLLEYQELKIALQNSEDAKTQARIAIWVTAGFGLLQCVLTVIQIW